MLPLLKTLQRSQCPKKKGTTSHLPLHVQPGFKLCFLKKHDGLQVPQCSWFSCISKPHPHHITPVVRKRDTTREGLTAVGPAHEIKCEKWDTSCHIGKQKRCHSDQRLQPSSVSQRALGIPEGEYLPFSSQQTTVTPMLNPENLRIWKHRILAPDSRGAYQRSCGALYRDDRTISPWLAKLQGNHCHVHSVPNQPAPASIWHNIQNPDYWPNITPLHRNFLFLEAIKIVGKPLSHPLF